MVIMVHNKQSKNIVTTTRVTTSFMVVVCWVPIQRTEIKRRSHDGTKSWDVGQTGNARKAVLKGCAWTGLGWSRLVPEQQKPWRKTLRLGLGALLRLLLSLLLLLRRRHHLMLTMRRNLLMWMLQWLLLVLLHVHRGLLMLETRVCTCGEVTDTALRVMVLMSRKSRIVVYLHSGGAQNGGEWPSSRSLIWRWSTPPSVRSGSPSPLFLSRRVWVSLNDRNCRFDG